METPCQLRSRACPVVSVSSGRWLTLGHCGQTRQQKAMRGGQQVHSHGSPCRPCGVCCAGVLGLSPGQGTLWTTLLLTETALRSLGPSRWGPAHGCSCSRGFSASLRTTSTTGARGSGRCVATRALCSASGCRREAPVRAGWLGVTGVGIAVTFMPGASGARTPLCGPGSGELPAGCPPLLSTSGGRCVWQMPRWALRGLWCLLPSSVRWGESSVYHGHVSWPFSWW